jgi:hypothetical protein
MGDGDATPFPKGEDEEWDLLVPTSGTTPGTSHVGDAAWVSLGHHANNLLSLSLPITTTKARCGWVGRD